MLLFIDESGDPGLKIHHGSSRFFTVALVVVVIDKSGNLEFRNQLAKYLRRKINQEEKIRLLPKYDCTQRNLGTNLAKNKNSDPISEENAAIDATVLVGINSSLYYIAIVSISQWPGLFMQKRLNFSYQAVKV